MTLLIDDVGQHRVLQMPENVQGSILYGSVFPFCHSAGQRLPQPFEVITYVVKVMQLGLQAIAKQGEQVMEFDDRLANLFNVARRFLRACAQCPEDHVEQVRHP